MIDEDEGHQRVGHYPVSWWVPLRPGILLNVRTRLTVQQYTRRGLSSFAKFSSARPECRQIVTRVFTTVNPNKVDEPWIVKNKPVLPKLSNKLGAYGH